MAEKIKLFVNGQEVEVESGKNLIDALGAVGIEIPHLCYHPALGADGNCRLCLVGIEEGRPPVVPACKTRAAEGMKVLLDVDNIKRIQRNVMELELINHPIDCPVCDQAGECKLQDFYMKYDGQKSRMTVKPVLKAKKMDFGCGVVHDQERCVLCARCVRFTRLITKTGELGIVNRTDAARVNIFPAKVRSGVSYGISKYFVIWYAKAEAARFGTKNVRTLSITPGNFETPMGELEKNEAQTYLKYNAINRLGQPDEIAALYAACADPAMGYLTGADIVCDGGCIAGGASAWSK